MTRLVVVSNRVDLPPGDAAPGGLAISLAATLSNTHSLWFGWSGEIDSGGDTPRRHQRNGIDYAIVDLSSEDHRDYYLGFCNRVLWPLSHGRHPDPSGQNDAWYRAYRRVNARMAKQLQPLLRRDDVLWIHDYHLLPLGHFLRQAGCRNPIGHFLHVPFPALPDDAVSRELLENLSAYDLLGFQTPRDLSAFEDAARRYSSAGAMSGDGVATGVFPVGVAVDSLRRAAAAMSDEAVTRWWSAGRSAVRIVGADRLDDSKALPQRWRAYREWLRDFPAGNYPSYLQFVTPSRLELAAHRRLQERLRSDLATSKYFDTLRCIFAAVPHVELMGILAKADIGLVTPRHDGMNLLAKEFVAVQPEENPGVLVLSHGAGAAVELEAAVLVQTADERDLLEALRRAIKMPLSERRERHQRLLGALRRNELPRWRERFIDRLLEVRSANERAPDRIRLERHQS